MNDDDLEALLHDVASRAARYDRSLESRPVFPPPAAIAGLDALDVDLPDEGLPAVAVVAELDRHGSPATVASTGGRYFGFVTGATLPAALGAGWLGAAWDQNGALPVMSPVVARIDTVALRWVADCLGLGPGIDGAFVSGATMANLSGLAAARHHVLAATGWDVEADGLFGAPSPTVVVGEEAHSTLYKALGLLGLGRRRVVTVPADSEGRLRSERLPDVSGPIIVCAQAGNVNSGACDPFEAIVEWARERDAWVHVDGAFGLWAAAAPRRAELVAGVAGADSWATDAHKWLNVTYDCGIVMTRHPQDLGAAMSATAAYLPDSGGRRAMELSPQSSQRGRSIEVWAALRHLGRDGLADLIERCCRLAGRLAEGLAASGAEILNEVVLNQVVAAFGSTERTNAVIAAVQADGTCWAGPTVWRDRTAMRLSVSSWRTTDADIDRTIEAVSVAHRNV